MKHTLVLTSLFRCRAVAPSILCLGNPLLDVALPVDEEFLRRHNLKLDTIGLIDANTALKLWNEIKDDPLLTKIAGGGTLNTCRIFRALKKSVRMHYFGAIGKDESGSILRNLLDKVNINHSFQTIPDVPTGQCFCFVQGDKSCLVAHLGATAKFDTNTFKAHLASNPFFATLKKQLFIIEGFVIVNCADACRHLVDNYKRSNISYVFTLSAPYIIGQFTDTVKYLVQKSSFVFGRASEFAELSKAYGCGGDLKKLNEMLAGDGMKVLVATDSGNDITVLTSKNGVAHRKRIYPVPRVNPKMLKNTVGCGDSFVAGFLSAYVEGCKLDQCVLAGTTTAQKVITQRGCRLPPT